MFKNIIETCNKFNAALEHNYDPTEEEIIHYLTGNLCRCTGYMGQLRAIKTYMGVK